MLIVSKNYSELDSIIKNEASGRKLATDIIGKFIAELTRIKSELGDNFTKEAAILNKTIGNLIRSWSDVCAVAYSEAVVEIVKAGYNYVFDIKSNSANFRKWLSTLNYDDESVAKSAVFAMSQACTDKDSRYVSTKDFKELYGNYGIDVKFDSIPTKITFTNGYDDDKKSFIINQTKRAQSPFYYEHYKPVDQVRANIYKIVKDQPKDMQKQISDTLTCMLVCWITGYENSRIDDKYKTFRESPFDVYTEAKIKLFANKNGGGAFTSKEALDKHIGDQLENDNK